MLYGQKPEPLIWEYRETHGFNKLSYYDIQEDREGFLWFSNTGKVTQYDGKVGKHFFPYEFPGGPIFKMYSDYGNRTWFIAANGKLSYHQNGQIIIYPYNDIISELIRRNKCSSFYVDKEDNIHLGVRGKGYWRISAKGDLKQIIGPESGIDGVILLKMEDGSPFICNLPREVPIEKGVSDTISLLDDSLRLLNKISFVETEKSHEAFPYIYTIKRSNQEVLIAKGNALVSIHVDHYIERLYFSVPIIGLLEDRRQGLWISLMGKGIQYLPEGMSKKNTKTYLSSINAVAAEEDFEGNIWIRSDYGVYQVIKPHLPRYYVQTPGIKNEDIIGVVLNRKGECLLGTNRGYIYKISSGDSNLVLEDSVPNGMASRFFFDSLSNELWVGSYAQLYCKKLNGAWLEVLQDNEQIPKQAIHALWKNDQTGDLWVGISDVLLCVRDYKIAYISDNLGSPITTIAGSSKGELWVGCMDGLRLLNDGKFVHLGNTFSELKSSIYATFFDGKSLWVSSNVDGLYRILGDTIQEITYPDGQKLGVNNFTIDKRVLWTITLRGLHSISINNPKLANSSYKIETYSLYGRSVGARILKKENKFWTARIIEPTICIFNLEDLHNEELLPKVSIRNVKINKRDTVLLSDYQLSYTQNFIELDYIGLRYNPQRKVYYSYKLEGVDKKWQSTAKNYTQYTTLPPGDYTFYLKSQTGGGTWTEPIYINFHIAPPWWETWWARTGMGLILLSIVYAIFRIRLSVLRRRDELEIQFIQAEQKALRAQLNPHFFFNALNSVQNFILQNKPEASMNFLTKFTKLMRQTLDNSERTLVPVQQELKSLTNYLDLEVIRSNNGFDYEIKVDESVNPKESYIPSMLIQPYVENAVKHGLEMSGKEGRLLISIQKEKNQIMCVIKDNGIGRVEALKRKQSNYRSIGTQLTTDRIKLISLLYKKQLTESIEDMRDESGKAIGTKVSLTFPSDLKL